MMKKTLKAVSFLSCFVVTSVFAQTSTAPTSAPSLPPPPPPLPPAAVAPAPQPTPAGGPVISGTYKVTGANPGNGASYTGTVTVNPKGSVYEIIWKVGPTYQGLGIRNGNILSVGWSSMGQGGYGVVSYTIEPNGNLKGVWAIPSSPALGTENWTR